MTINDRKKLIVSNLRDNHPAKWVAPVVAVDGLEPIALQALSELVADNIVEEKHIAHNGVNMPLVRYVNKHEKPKLTVINGDKE